MSRVINSALLNSTLIIVWTFILSSTSFQARTLAQTPERGDEAPPDYFIEVEVDNLEPYVGQQITYTLRRFQASELPEQPYYQDHPYAGFWSTPLQERPSYTTTIAGREYLVQPTHLALFPSIPGPLTISPTRLVIPGDQPAADKILESDPIYLNVQPWPQNSPTTFNGAVGRLEITAEFSQAEVEIDQPVRLVVTIKGTGNIGSISEPTIPVMQNWRFSRSSESQSTAEIPLTEHVVEGTRRFEWTLVPTEAGTQFFPGIEFTYFDPQTATYHSLRTDTISVIVRPLNGQSTLTSPIPRPEPGGRRFTSDIRHIKPVPAELSMMAGLSTLRPPLLLGCAVLPLLAVAGVWFWREQHRRRATDRPQARRKAARRRARKALTETQAMGGDPNVAVRLALSGYLEDKLAQPITGLTSDQLVDLLNEQGLSPDLVSRVQALLDRVDAGRFAPVSDESASTRSISMIASTRVLIDDLERFFAKRGR